MQFLLCGQKHTIPTITMVIVYWKSAIQEKVICLAYNSSGLWDREVSAVEGQTIKIAWEQVVVTLLCFIYMLKITQIEVFLLQTTLTSPESLRNARNIWGAISLAPQESALPVQEQMWKGILPQKGGTKMSDHTKTLTRQMQPKEKFCLSPIRPNCRSSQVTRSWNKKSARIYLV